MPPLTHYEVLGVSRRASAAEIRTAYRAAARTRHPDAGGSLAAMRTLNQAWHVLGDPTRRAAYDRSLAPAGDPRPAGPAVSGDPPERSAEWAEVYDDLLDDTPIGPIRPVEGWWALAPPATLVFGVGLALGAFVLGSPALLVFSAVAVFVAIGLFVLAPLRAMTRPSSKDRHGS
ncbi:MAG: J domain-containing protein [Acidimicrobiales bacterium]